MKTKSFILLVTLFALAACGEVQEPTDTISINSVEQNYRIISKEEALANLEDFLKEVEIGTRSSLKRKIKSVDVFPTSTRSESEVEAYIVNYDDNAGYAVLGARSDMIDIIAVTEEGSIDPVTLSVINPPSFEDDTLVIHPWPQPGGGQIQDPNGTETVIDSITVDNLYSSSDDDYYIGGNVSDFISAAIQNGVRYRQLSSMPSEDVFDPNEESEDEIGTDEIQPILPLLSTNWGQSAPYNNFCKLYNGVDKRLAGCSSVAAAMIMAYNRFPTNLVVNGVTLNWDIISETEAIYSSSSEPQIVHIPLLLGSLFWKCNRAAFADDWTMIAACEIKKRFDRLGYSNVILHKDLLQYTDNMWQQTLSMLRAGKPVYISALGCSDIDGLILPSGHSWVIDGAHSDRSMLHCNWGWRGASNGYFSKDCFRVVTSSSTETYSWFFRVITYDVPSTSVTRYVDF